MNSAAHVICAVAVLWLSIFSYQTLDNPYLGFVGLGLFFLVVVMTFQAVQDDIALGVGRRRGRRGRG